MFYKWLVVTFFLPSLLLAQTNRSIQTYQENELWGLTTDTRITPAVYDTLIPILNTDLYIAKKHGKGVNSTGIITDKGKAIIPFNYSHITPFANYFMVSKKKQNIIAYGVINRSNKIILNLRFKQISALNSIWIVKTTIDELQLYTHEGNFIKSLLADSISLSESNQFLKIYKRGKIGILDSKGNQLFPASYKNAIMVNGVWKTELFPNWQVILPSDTITIAADTLKIWDIQHFIIKINNKYYLSKLNQPVGKSYEFIQRVSANLALIKNSNLWGVLNKKGEEILATSHGNVYYSKGYLYTKDNHKWSVYDSLGKKKSVFTYDSIGTISNGLFPIKRKGRWGFMNRGGVEVIHCIYDSTANFKKGQAIIQYFGATGIINLKGDWVVKPKDEKITGYSFNFYIFKKGDLYYLKNYCEELIYFTPNELIFKDETIYEIRDGYTNKVSSLGTLVKKEVRQKEGSESWKIIKIGAKYGFKDTNGVLKITYRYDSLLLFSEGLAAFKLRKKWGFINKEEEIVIQPLYKEVTSFKNGLSVISINGNKGLLKDNGDFVLKPKFKHISLIFENLWLVNEGGLKGIYNSDGKIIIQPKFDQVYYVKPKLIIVMRNGKYGAVNSKGQNIIPRIYDFISFNSDYQLLVVKHPRD